MGVKHGTYRIWLHESRAAGTPAYEDFVNVIVFPNEDWVIVSRLETKHGPLGAMTTEELVKAYKGYDVRLVERLNDQASADPGSELG